MLREMQHAFGQSLLKDFKTPPPHNLIAGDPERGAARLMIHRGNVVESLVNALGHTFPVIKGIAGEHNFRVLATAYVRTRPPRRPELMAYGDDFSDFAASYAAAVRDFPFLPDLARLEWTIHESYFAAAAPALTPEILAAIPPNDLSGLQFAFHPAARLVVSADYPIHTILLTRAEPDSSTQHGDAVLVTRPHGPVETYKLSLGESVFLGAIMAGLPLAEAADGAIAAAPHFDLAAALSVSLARSVFRAEVSFIPSHNGEAK